MLRAADMTNDFRETLQAIAAVLDDGQDSKAALVRSALAGSEADFDSFLRSNDLWGGSGSIADCGVVHRADLRAVLERWLILLGHQQLAKGNANQRTAMWVSAFELWRRPDTTSV